MRTRGDDVNENLRSMKGSVATDDAAEAASEATPVETIDNSQQKKGDDHSLSLDDLATQLMQVEVDDHEQLKLFKNALTALVNGREYSETVRAVIAIAVPNLENIIEQRPAEAAAVLEGIGRRIEEAMGLAEAQDGKSVPPREEKDPSPMEDESCDSPVPNGPQGRTDYLAKDVDPNILREFVTESMELIENAEEALLELENNPGDQEAVATVFRAFHTIKGTSSFLKVRIVSELAHHAESLLSSVRDGKIVYNGPYAELSLYAVDMLKNLIHGVNQVLQGKPLCKPGGYDDLMFLLQNPERTREAEDTAADELPWVAPRMGDILVAQGNVDRKKIEEAVAKKSGRPLGVELLREKAVTVKDVARALRTQQRMKSGGGIIDSSVRVQTQRLDRLIDMVGEIVIAHSMIAQDAAIVNNRDQELQKKISHASKIVRELQDLSMSMRMVPLAGTFQKMARVVRDLATKTGKSVTFIAEGERTEIDRNMVDLINDPLMHMMRNAVDHGIGLPEERIKQGKPREGTVTLSAYHSAGNVVVEICDDGCGLDRDAIIEKAKRKGIISQEQSLSDREIMNLIFDPGFSTVESVTDVSGRGVGLDVVKRNVEKLRGKIEVQSTRGKGSIFTLRVPLTLGIIDGMVILVGDERYIVPTISIVRSLRPRAKDLATVFNKGEMLSVDGKLIPLFRLGNLFDISNSEEDPTRALVVVVEDNDRHAGLVADELVGQQQIVIKSLGESLKGIPGILGGAIMGDGRVGLIVDVGGLVSIAHDDVTEKYAEAV